MWVPRPSRFLFGRAGVRNAVTLKNKPPCVHSIAAHPCKKTQGWGTPGFLNSNVIKSPGHPPGLRDDAFETVRVSALAGGLGRICWRIFLRRVHLGFGGE